MKKGYLLFCVSLLFLGAGCGSQKAEDPAKPTGGLPRLDIISPPNNFQTSSTMVFIAGMSGTEEVVINDIVHTINARPFQIPVELHPGTNIITIHAGTGYATTTVTRIIERL